MNSQDSASELEYSSELVSRRGTERRFYEYRFTSTTVGKVIQLGSPQWNNMADESNGEGSNGEGQSANERATVVETPDSDPRSDSGENSGSEGSED